MDRRASAQDIDAQTSQRLCDRRRGVGGDGVLVLLPSAQAAAKMVVHNADGSIAQMCGNGLRCVAKFLADHDAARPKRLDVETDAGVLGCDIEYGSAGAHEVTLSMGAPRWRAADLPTGDDGKPFVDLP